MGIIDYMNVIEMAIKIRMFLYKWAFHEYNNLTLVILSFSFLQGGMHNVAALSIN